MNFHAAFKGYEHAYNGISFSPEKRIASDRAEFKRTFEEVQAKLLIVARSEDQKRLLLSEMARYAAGYEKHFSAYLAAKSRCMSTMITGAANFPTRRNQKNNDIERRRLDEFCAWHDRATAAMKKAILAARTPSEIKADEWEILKAHINYEIQTIAAIDAGTKHLDRRAFINSLAGFIKRMAAKGQAEEVTRALAYIAQRQKTLKKPVFTARHSVWKQEEAATLVKAALDEKQGREDQTLASFEGVELIAAHGAERLRFVFDDKPDSDTRSALKGSAWKWSPHAGAWQRKDTANARYSAKQIIKQCGFEPLQTAV